MCPRSSTLQRPMKDYKYGRPTRSTHVPVEQSISYAAPTVGHRSSDQIVNQGSMRYMLLLYTIMMLLLVASSSLQQTLGRRPTPFSKHKRRTCVVLENDSPLQLKQRHMSAGGRASVVDLLPGKSAEHDHNGIAGHQHKPATDTGDASDSFQQIQAPDIRRPGEQLPSTAQTAPSVDGEVLCDFYLSAGGGASVVDPLPGNTPAAIGRTQKSLRGHETPPA